LGATEEYRLSASEFEAIQRWAFEHFGLELRQGKQPLVVARLSKILRRRGLAGFADYLALLERDKGNQAGMELIDALTTNHTSFFREPDHFTFIKQDFLRTCCASGQPIRAWSAACSSGEEPYSIAFSILEELGQEALSRADIWATDISTKVLERARRGMYREEQLTGVPDASIRRFFLRGTASASGWFKVRPEIAARVRFDRLNLMEPWPAVRPFPLIFCRNVMIYFSKSTQAGLVERLAEKLEPGGFLLVGHAESLSGIHHGLEYVRPAIHRKAAEFAAGRRLR